MLLQGVEEQRREVFLRILDELEYLALSGAHGNIPEKKVRLANHNLPAHPRMEVH